MELPEFLSKLSGVKSNGDGYTAHCPAHEDKRNSLSVAENDGRLLIKCFAGCETKDVVSAMDLKLADLFTAQRPARNGRDIERYKGLPIVAYYDYTDENGTLLYQVMRTDPKGDFPCRHPDPDKSGSWIWKMKGVTRVLYKLPAVLAAIRTYKKVFLVEGEKDADSLARIGLTGTSITGGSSAPWNKSYSEVLNKTTVVILPDNDDPGRKFATRVHTQLRDSTTLYLPGLPPSGDVSDWIAAGGTRQNLIAQARTALEERDAQPSQPPPADDEDLKRPFIPLGYDNGLFAVFSRRSGQVIHLTSSSLARRSTFLELAPLQYWEVRHMGPRGVDFTVAADQLIQDCLKAGLFEPSRRRGRGAWWDNGRAVLHQGDALIIDGETVSLTDTASGYIYEKAPRLNISHRAALSAEDGLRLVSLCQMLTWESSVAAQLFAGWCAIAPICGVLRWRPHIWLTGPASCGKSWVMENIVGALLGDMALRVQSVTTEAGLRQALGQDARPVLFDEAEMEDQKGQLNIQRVLELARQASSESGAVIMKGSATGHVMTYNVRSCFALSSIGVGVKRHADETRVTVLTMRRSRVLTDDERMDDVQHFKSLQAKVIDLCTPEYSAGLIARACRMAGVIRTNAETFAIALTQTDGNRRVGDQLGTLLAGYWSLWRDDEITLAEAVDYVQGLSLDAITVDGESTDENRCMAHLMEQRIRVDMPTGAPTESTIGELVEACDPPTLNDSLPDVPMQVASKHLRRWGIKVAPEGLKISTTHSGIGRLLAGSPWATQWSVFLRRLPGATIPRQTERFLGGIVSKIILIPWATINGEQDTVEVEESLENDSPF